MKKLLTEIRRQIAGIRLRYFMRRYHKLKHKYLKMKIVVNTMYGGYGVSGKDVES